MGFRVFATRNTDHGGWAGISQQCRHLDRLVDLSSSDDYSSRHDNYSHGYHILEGHLRGLDLTFGQHSSTDYSNTDEYSTSSTEYRGLGIITMELILHNPYRHITLMLDPLPNHLSLQDLTHKIYYYPYGNYIPDFYTYRGDDDNDDFVPLRNSMWK